VEGTFFMWRPTRAESLIERVNLLILFGSGGFDIRGLVSLEMHGGLFFKMMYIAHFVP
jgi:hypothetical protein